jgi:hypothetical protein
MISKWTAVLYSDYSDDVRLDNITSAVIEYGLDTPAGSLDLTAVTDKIPPMMKSVRLYRDGVKVFDGLIDRQVSSYSSKGKFLTVEARTIGGMLLDNEASPRTLWNVPMSAIYKAFAMPYGLGFRCSGDRRLSQFTVSKGWSEWDVMTAFCSRAYDITPYVDKNNVIRVERLQNSEPIIIGDGVNPFISFEREFVPYNVISKVVLRDENGFYDTAVHNSGARGIRRKRYVIPPDEYADDLALDPNQRITRSMLNMETVTVRLPRYTDVNIGQPVRPTVGGAVIHNIVADTVTHSIGAQGEITTLKLVNGVYRR